jgi:hypothetical protein
VREAEMTARKIATERVRKFELLPDPEISELEEKLANTFGARVHIERSQKGGKIMIDFFSNDDLRAILEAVNNKQDLGTNSLLNNHIAKTDAAMSTDEKAETALLDDRSTQEKKEEEENDNLYSNFVV